MTTEGFKTLTEPWISKLAVIRAAKQNALETQNS